MSVATPRPTSQSYAALAPGQAPPRPARSDPELIAFYREEADRLAALKTSLWQAFLSAPAAGIPLGLVDLANAYAGLLRQQITLMSATATPPRPAPPQARPLGKSNET